MNLSLDDLWKLLKSKCKPNRNTIIIVPSRNFMVEMVAHAFEEEAALRMINRGAFCVQITYANHTVKVMVGYADAAEQVCRVKEQLLGRRDQDVILVRPLQLTTKLRHEIQCLCDTFEAQLSVVAK